MAGSYHHCVDDDHRLLAQPGMAGMLDNFGDVYEAIEEMYKMIWALAEGRRDLVEWAQTEAASPTGMDLSPGRVTYDDE